MSVNDMKFKETLVQTYFMTKSLLVLSAQLSFSEGLMSQSLFYWFCFLRPEVNFPQTEGKLLLSPVSLHSL